MMKQYPQILRALTDTPLAIERKKLDQIVAFLDLRLAGGAVPEAIRAKMKSARSAAGRNRISGAVAVIPIIGSITHRVSVLQEASGGISVQEIQRDFRDAMAEPSVSTILLDIDSPGGGVDGIPELFDEIFAARSKKRIVAVANAMSASAAFWLMSAAGEVVITPSGQVGSIGVFALHLDESAALEMAGLRPTFISAGKFKVEGNSAEPLAEGARASIQADVDAFYGMFVRAVARGRGVSVDHVLERFGQGRMVLAKDAKALGMVDRVATFDQALSQSLGSQRPGAVAHRTPPLAFSNQRASDKWRRRLEELEHGVDVGAGHTPWWQLQQVLARKGKAYEDTENDARAEAYWRSRIAEGGA